eukprot:g2692.t1
MTQSARKQRKFFWSILVIIAIFYGVPGTQVMSNYVRNYDSNSTTSSDCRLNLDCAKPAFGVPAFNNVVSNSLYVVFGVGFVLIVQHRQRSLSEKRKKDDACGTRSTPDILYACGLALAAEGYFSAIYHLCPNKTTCQFDFTFILIAISLMGIAMYEKRHADNRALAEPTQFYSCITLLIFMNGVLQVMGGEGGGSGSNSTRVCGMQIAEKMRNMIDISNGQEPNPILVHKKHFKKLTREFTAYVGEVIPIRCHCAKDTECDVDGCAHLTSEMGNCACETRSEMQAYAWELSPASRYAIDARWYRNVAPFVNHACADTNVEVRYSWSEHSDSSLPTVAYFAKRAIVEGEELLVNYRQGAQSRSRKVLDECKCHVCKKEGRTAKPKTKKKKGEEFGSTKTMESLPPAACESMDVAEAEEED